MRAVAILLTLAFGWRVSLAYLSPCLHDASSVTSSAEAKGDGCCPGAARAERSPATEEAGERAAERRVDDDAGHGEDGDCSCPIDCSPCCGGAILHALPAVAPPPIVAVAVLADLPVPEPAVHRALADPAGILHVPRAS